MRTRLFAITRWGFALALGGGFATACVRADPPREFICNSQHDCEEGETCRGGQCKPAGSCEVAFDCGDSLKICRESQCVAVQCTSGADGACNGYRCETNTNRCHTQCNNDTFCQSGFHCDGGKCVSGPPRSPNDEPCSRDAECVSGLCCARASSKVCSARCEPAGASCTSAKDCKDPYCCAQFAAGSTCSASACLSSTCTQAQDCAANEYCTVAMRCAAKLAGGAACTANQQCLSGTCAGAVCRGDGSEGDACEADYECTPGRKCCAVAPGRLECAPQSAECLAAVGYDCDQDAQCASGECRDYAYCTKKCSTDADCGTSPLGYPNVCVGTSSPKYCQPGCSTSSECAAYFDVASACKVSGTLGYCDAF